MKHSWYEITDISDFVEYARRLIFKSFGEMQQENNEETEDLLAGFNSEDVKEMDKVLSQAECELIAKSFFKTRTNKKTKTQAYFINEKILFDMLESFNSRMISNMLNKLVNDGLLESAYDIGKDDFIFWRKNIGNNNNEEEASEAD